MRAFDAFAPYYASVARQIADQAQRRGYYVIINNTTGGGPGMTMEERLRCLRSRHVKSLRTG